MSAARPGFGPEGSGNASQSSVEGFLGDAGPADPSKINNSDLGPSGGSTGSVARALALWAATALAIGVTVTAAIHYADRPQSAITPIVDPCEHDDRAEGHEACQEGTP